MRYLTYKEVAAINQYAIQRFSPGEQVGIKSPELLDSAVHRPQQSVFQADAYETLFMKAAALFESIAKNHAFYNANKRTAFLALTQFLLYNGYDFEMGLQNDQVDFTVNVVNNKYTLREIANVIEENSSSYN
ncbi:type II toxin-antitoxin system death-on-curing family toxin [Lentibacillus lipolyticus]|nr:type II toxin-antitoxin system death-on-curing family toxin [Lentibacillus lipolyticus]